MGSKDKKTKNKKKKVVIFIPRFPVISETFIQRDIVKLVQLDNLDITVLATKKGEGKLDESIKDLVVYQRLNIFACFFASFYLVFRPLRSLRAFKYVIQDKSMNIMKRFYTFLTSVGYSYVFSKLEPDEIHVHFLNHSSTTVLIVSIILGVPFSINAHARDVTEYPTLVRQKLKLAKFITVCNTRAFETLKGYSTKTDKIHLTRHGIDEETLFNYPLELQKPDRPLIYSGGARLVQKKGLEYLIKASRILLDRGVNHEVHITGGGPMFKKLTSLIEELDLKENVFIHGGDKGVPFELISQYYRIADIVALANINMDSGDADGVPNALIEASFAKVPIVTTDAGSISEFILNGITGVQVAQRNEEQLATAIQRLVFEEKIRKSYAEASYERAKQLYSSEANIKQLEKLLLM